MSETIRAKRAEIELGNMTIEVFQLPNGEYSLSQTQVCEVVGKSRQSLSDFLKSKSPEALPYKGFRCQKLPIEGNNAKISVVPIALAGVYWAKESLAGNTKAAHLLAACVVESIERRADKVFGISRTEREYNKRLTRFFNPSGELAESLRQLEQYSEDSRIYDHKTYEAIKNYLNKNCKYPIDGMTEDEFRDDLASLSARTKRWKLRIEDELEFPFDNKREYSYPDLTSDVFLCSTDVDGVEVKVIFIFECKNPIVKVAHIKQCIYDRMYLEAAREKYKTDYIFLFFVAPLGGEPDAFSYLDRRLAPDDKACVKIITVKKMAEFLKSQIPVTNPQKKGEITKRYHKLLNYQIYNPLLTSSPSNQE